MKLFNVSWENKLIKFIKFITLFHFTLLVVLFLTFQISLADESVNLYLISVDSEELAIKIVKQLKNGESFKKLALKYSNHPSVKEGGEIKDVNFDNFQKKLLVPLKKSRAGEIIGPIQDSEHYLILRWIYEYFEMGLKCYRKKKFDKALEYFQKELVENGDDINCYNLGGIIFAHNKEYERAKEYFTKAIEMNEHLYDPQVNLGMIYFTSGEYENALPRYENALKIDPVNPNALLKYAVCTLELEKNLQEAKDYLTNYLLQSEGEYEAEDRKRANFLLSLVYFKLGKILQAEKFMEITLADAPSDEQRQKFLGKAKEVGFLPQPKPIISITKRESSEKPSPAKKAQEYSVQVAAYKNRSDAERMAVKLRTKGYEAFIKRLENPQGEVWHRVRIGSFPSSEKAQKWALQVFKKKENMDFWIVKNQ